MKRVIVLKSAPSFPIQGADISMFERMSLLKERGWSGILVCRGITEHAESFRSILQNLKLPYKYEPELNRICFHYAETECQLYLGDNPEQIFDRARNLYGADAVFGNVRDPIVLDYIAERSSTLPHLMFLTEDEYPKKDSPQSTAFGLALAKIKQIAVASTYLKESLQKEYGVKAELLTNAVATARYSFERTVPGDFITLMHPYQHKGVDLFISLVKQLPEYRFQVLAGMGEEYRQRKAELLSYPNLVLAQYTKDHRDLYSRSRMVLVPSLWQEGFSRVIIEALCSGTPVIAADRGAMRETGGDAVSYVSIEKFNNGEFNCEPWVEAIKRYEDPAFSDLMSEKAKSRIVEFESSLQASIAKLALMLEDSVGE